MLGKNIQNWYDLYRESGVIKNSLYENNWIVLYCSECEFNDVAATDWPIWMYTWAVVQFEIQAVFWVLWMFVAWFVADIAMMRSFLFAIVALPWYLCVDFYTHYLLQSPIPALPSQIHCQLYHHQTTVSFLPALVAFAPNPSDIRHIAPTKFIENSWILNGFFTKRYKK